MENTEASDNDKVNIMTLHAAKGLEFDCVFLPGWEEELLPHQRALDEGGTKALEEERRLAHVGLTRARRWVQLSFAANRRVYNQWRSCLPSRFIDELPPEHLELRSDTGFHAGRAEAEETSFFATTGGGPRPYDPAATSGGLIVEGRAERLPVRQATAAFNTGDRVFHQKFGYGRVMAVEGNRLQVDFDKAGTKKVVDSFVSPA